MTHPIRTLAVIALSMLLAGPISVAPAFAQTASDVVGTWTLVSSVVERDGKKTDQFGPGAKGMLTFDSGGRFMLTIVGADLPKFASDNRATGTPEENKAVVGRSIALFGTYAVNPADKTIVLRIDTATFPNWSGTEQKRLLVGGGADELKYITPSASGGGTGTVTWRRAK